MKLRENIYSVRAVDGDLRVLHGYQIPIGTTYNAYLVLDEKVTLIDFVKHDFAAELIRNITEIIGDRPVDYLICNHAEPDHSGALPEIVRHYPQAVVYATPSCLKELKAYYPESSFEGVAVKKGDTLSTGTYTFQFIPMPMIHWPDSMSAYLVQEKLLFSNDAFGQHIGTGELSDREISLEHLLSRAGDYYANIVLPYSVQVGKLLGAVSGLEIDMICPAHGVILEQHLSRVVAKYSDWCENKTIDNKVVIIYDTMWGTTHKLAERLRAEYTEKNCEVEFIQLSKAHVSYAMAHLLEAKYVFVGSPTLNNQAMPTVAAFLSYMRGLKPKNRIGCAFGSYGWSGESITQINEALTACGFEMLDPIKVMWNV